MSKQAGPPLTSQKINAYVTALSNQSLRSAKVFKTHLKSFHAYNDEKTDDLLKSIKAGKADVFDILNGYAAFLIKRGTMTGKTIAYSVKVARRFIEFANDIEISQRKFKANIKLPKGTEHRAKALEKNDIVSLINACADMRVKTFVLFLAESGCRAEEALSVRLGEADFEKAVIRLNGNFTKTKRDRDVRLTAEMTAQLKTWLAYKYRPRTINKKKADVKPGDNVTKYYKKWAVCDIKPMQDPGDFVFLPYGETAMPFHDQSSDYNELEIRKIQTHLKNAYYLIYHAFKDAAARAGYPRAHFHQFRHFVYTTLQDLGDHEYAEHYIGHANSTYWRKSDAALAETFKRFENYLTYLDVGQLEAHRQDMTSQMKEMEEKNKALELELHKIRKKQQEQDAEIERMNREGPQGLNLGVTIEEAFRKKAGKN